MVLNGKFSQEYPVDAGVRQYSILGPTLFLLYINDFPEDVIFDIAIYADDTALYSKCDQASICGSNLNWLLNLSLINKKWLVDFSAGKTQLVLFDQSNTNDSIDVKMDGSVLEEKSSFKMLRLTFSSKLDWGCYVISIAKTASKKIGALIRSVKFLSPEVGLYLYKSTILRPCMEYCYHFWAGARGYYLELLGKLQNRIYKAVDPSLSASVESLAHHRNVTSLSLFYRYYFGRYSSEQDQLVRFFSRGRSTHYSDRLLDYSVRIPRCYKEVYVSSFFPHTARLWNSLPIE